MVRMRTAKQVIEEIKTKDPSTNFTYHALRMKALGGHIPFVQIGKKRLFNMDIIEAYLSGEYAPDKQSEQPQQSVRKII